MKKSLQFSLVCIGMAISSGSVSAQNMGAVNAAISQNHFNFHNQMMMQQMLHISMETRSTVLFNPKSDYLVVLKNGSTKEVRSKIFFDENHISYLQFEDKSLKKNDPNRIQRIYPKETKSIKLQQSYSGYSPEGMPADSCWLFKTVAGKINGYTFLPATDIELNDAYFKFFQKGLGSLQPLNKDTLLVMMGENEKAKKLIEKDKAYKALLVFNKEN